MEILTTPIPDHRAVELRIVEQDVPFSFQEVAQRWQEDAKFCEQFNQALSDAPFESYRWELPGLTRENWQAPFISVVQESLELRRRANPSSFAEHFPKAVDEVVVFANFGGSAQLIVPTPVSVPEAYPHLAAFTRGAPHSQRLHLWRAVGTAFVDRISTKAVWLSTAGAGVPWLHVRLDDRPKYYSYAPYRNVLSPQN